MLIFCLLAGFMAYSETGAEGSDGPEDTAHLMNSKHHSSCSLYDLILIENGFLTVFFLATIKRATFAIIKGNRWRLLL